MAQSLLEAIVGHAGVYGRFVRPLQKSVEKTNNVTKIHMRIRKMKEWSSVAYD
jgi:hypothetical protein